MSDNDFDAGRGGEEQQPQPPRQEEPQQGRQGRPGRRNLLHWAGAKYRDAQHYFGWNLPDDHDDDTRWDRQGRWDDESADRGVGQPRRDAAYRAGEPRVAPDGTPFGNVGREDPLRDQTTVETPRPRLDDLPTTATMRPVARTDARGDEGANGALDRAQASLDRTEATLDRTDASLDRTEAGLDRTEATLDRTGASLDRTERALGRRDAGADQSDRAGEDAPQQESEVSDEQLRQRLDQARAYNELLNTLNERYQQSGGQDVGAATALTELNAVVDNSTLDYVPLDQQVARLRQYLRRDEGNLRNFNTLVPVGQNRPDTDLTVARDFVVLGDRLDQRQTHGPDDPIIPTLEAARADFHAALTGNTTALNRLRADIIEMRYDARGSLQLLESLAPPSQATLEAEAVVPVEAAENAPPDGENEARSALREDLVTASRFLRLEDRLHDNRYLTDRLSEAVRTRNTGAIRTLRETLVANDLAIFNRLIPPGELTPDLGRATDIATYAADRRREASDSRPDAAEVQAAVVEFLNGDIDALQRLKHRNIRVSAVNVEAMAEEIDRADYRDRQARATEGLTDEQRTEVAVLQRQMSAPESREGGVLDWSGPLAAKDRLYELLGPERTADFLFTTRIPEEIRSPHEQVLEQANVFALTTGDYFTARLAIDGNDDALEALRRLNPNFAAQAEQFRTQLNADAPTDPMAGENIPVNNDATEDTNRREASELTTEQQHALEDAQDLLDRYQALNRLQEALRQRPGSEEAQAALQAIINTEFLGADDSSFSRERLEASGYDTALAFNDAMRARRAQHITALRGDLLQGDEVQALNDFRPEEGAYYVRVLQDLGTRLRGISEGTFDQRPELPDLATEALTHYDALVNGDLRALIPLREALPSDDRWLQSLRFQLEQVLPEEDLTNETILQGTEARATASPPAATRTETGYRARAETAEAATAAALPENVVNVLDNTTYGMELLTNLRERGTQQCTPELTAQINAQIRSMVEQQGGTYDAGQFGVTLEQLQALQTTVVNLADAEFRTLLPVLANMNTPLSERLTNVLPRPEANQETGERGEVSDQAILELRTDLDRARALRELLQRNGGMPAEHAYAVQRAIDNPQGRDVALAYALLDQDHRRLFAQLIPENSPARMERLDHEVTAEDLARARALQGIISALDADSAERCLNGDPQPLITLQQENRYLNEDEVRLIEEVVPIMQAGQERNLPTPEESESDRLFAEYQDIRHQVENTGVRDNFIAAERGEPWAEADLVARLHHLADQQAAERYRSRDAIDFIALLPRYQEYLRERYPNRDPDLDRAGAVMQLRAQGSHEMRQFIENLGTNGTERANLADLREELYGEDRYLLDRLTQPQQGEETVDFGRVAGIVETFNTLGRNTAQEALLTEYLRGDRTIEDLDNAQDANGTTLLTAEQRAAINTIVHEGERLPARQNENYIAGSSTEMRLLFDRAAAGEEGAEDELVEATLRHRQTNDLDSGGTPMSADEIRRNIQEQYERYNAAVAADEAAAAATVPTGEDESNGNEEGADREPDTAESLRTEWDTFFAELPDGIYRTYNNPRGADPAEARAAFMAQLTPEQRAQFNALVDRTLTLLPTLGTDPELANRIAAYRRGEVNVDLYQHTNHDLATGALIDQLPASLGLTAEEIAAANAESNEAPADERGSDGTEPPSEATQAATQALEAFIAEQPEEVRNLLQQYEAAQDEARREELAIQVMRALSQQDRAQEGGPGDARGRWLALQEQVEFARDRDRATVVAGTNATNTGDPTDEAAGRRDVVDEAPGNNDVTEPDEQEPDDTGGNDTERPDDAGEPGQEGGTSNPEFEIRDADALGDRLTTAATLAELHAAIPTQTRPQMAFTDFIGEPTPERAEAFLATVGDNPRIRELLTLVQAYLPENRSLDTEMVFVDMGQRLRDLQPTDAEQAQLLEQAIADYDAIMEEDYTDGNTNRAERLHAALGTLNVRYGQADLLRMLRQE